MRTKYDDVIDKRGDDAKLRLLILRSINKTQGLDEGN